MRATVIQFAPGTDKAANIEAASALMEAAARQDRPDFISLPEMWSCLGGDRATKLAQGEVLPERCQVEHQDGAASAAAEGAAAWHFLRDAARRLGATINGGSICEKVGDRLFNTSCVFDPHGREIARYRKIHLFDVTTPGGAGYRESSLFDAGRDIAVARMTERGGRDVGLGLAVCYDLRFPELFLALRRGGADVICLPSAFTAETGRDHWEVLIRARAIETQCWVVAAATCGEHADGQGRRRITYGHSLICDPWGGVQAELADEPGFVTATIDFDLLANVRASMPVLDHRRLA